MSSLKVLIYGSGAHASQVIFPSILLSRHAAIVGICDSNVVRAESLARHFGIRFMGDDVRSVLQASQIDAVVVVSNPEAHFRIAQECLGQNVSVFVEKPPCETTAQLRQLADLACTREVTCGVGMNLRFAEAVHNLKNWSLDGVGNSFLRNLQIEYFARLKRYPIWRNLSFEREFLLAQAIHPIDLAFSFLPDTQICKPVIHKLRAPTGFLARIAAHSEDGQLVTLMISNQTPKFRFRISAINGDGRHFCSESLWSVQGDENNSTSGQGLGLPRTILESLPSPLTSGFVRTGYQTNIGQFLLAIKEGRRHRPDFSDLLPTYELIDSIEATAPISVSAQHDLFDR